MTDSIVKRLAEVRARAEARVSVCLEALQGDVHVSEHGWERQAAGLQRWFYSKFVNIFMEIFPWLTALNCEVLRLKFSCTHTTHLASLG